MKIVILHMMLKLFCDTPRTGYIQHPYLPKKIIVPRKREICFTYCIVYGHRSDMSQILPTIDPLLPTGLPTGLQPDCLHGLRTTLRFVLVFPLSSFRWRVYYPLNWLSASFWSRGNKISIHSFNFLQPCSVCVTVGGHTAVGSSWTNSTPLRRQDVRVHDGVVTWQLRHTDDVSTVARCARIIQLVYGSECMVGRTPTHASGFDIPSNDLWTDVSQTSRLCIVFIR